MITEKHVKIFLVVVMIAIVALGYSFWNNPLKSKSGTYSELAKKGTITYQDNLFMYELEGDSFSREDLASIVRITKDSTRIVLINK